MEGNTQLSKTYRSKLFEAHLKIYDFVKIFLIVCRLHLFCGWILF